MNMSSISNEYRKAASAQGRRRLGLGIAAFGLLSAIWVQPVAAETLLRTAIGSDLRTITPGGSTDVNTGTVLQHIYEGLVAWRSDGTVAPMLSDSFSVSDDELTYTFKLRDGVTFHNGAPLTSAEVVWTWDQFMHGKPWGCRANFDGSRLVDLESVTAVDPLTVEFTLARPSAAFLTMLARTDCDQTGISHPDALDAEGNWSHAIGTGPFMLADWRKGEYIELAKFEDYKSRSEATDGLSGAKSAAVDRIRFTIIPDANTAKIALESGAIDMMFEVDPKFVKDLEANPDITIGSSPVAGVSGIFLQTTDPVLADPRIRQAFAHSLDTAAMRETITAGYGERCTGPIPLSSAFHGTVQEEGLDYDPERARELLQEAGYGGQQIAIATSDQYAGMHDTAILAQAMAGKVGMNISINVLESAAFFASYREGTYQMQVWQITSLDPSLTLDRFIGDKATQPEKPWGSKAAIDLLSEIFRTSDTGALQGLYDRVHELYLKEVPLVIWSCRYVISATRPNVQGYESWPGQRARLWNVSLK